MIIPKANAIDIAPFFKPAQTFPTIASLVNTLVPNIMIVAGIVCLVMIISSGFGLISAGQADPKAIEKTRNTLTYAVIGLIIIVIAFWLVKIIGIITGVNLDTNL